MFKAKVSFSGLISMHKGEVKEIKDKYLIDDLIKAGYIEPVEEKKKEAKSKK